MLVPAGKTRGLQEISCINANFSQMYQRIRLELESDSRRHNIVYLGC